ncbi:MAG: GDSL-type esterase/lipase family protein [Tannerella sp.]|nr:GDSL-type esterase/lipase family protein [Tannerella sp.]
MKKNIVLLVCLIFSLACAAQHKKSYAIVYIGNSITQGVLIDKPEENAPPVKASHYLSRQPGIELRGFSNQGVSGMTTVDYLPAQQTLFPKVVEAAKAFSNKEESVLIFSIMLGTNDSAIKGPNGSPVSPVQYFTNMKVIIDELLAIYPNAVFVLHRPVWYSPNTYNGAMYLREGLERLISYSNELDRLITGYAQKYPKQVFQGDTDAFDYFKANYSTELIPEEGNAGTFYLHPNLSGAAKLGEFWGKAIYKIITDNQL